jgi:hypothetical protein
MHAGNNMGIITTFKNLPQKARSSPWPASATTRVTHGPLATP